MSSQVPMPPQAVQRLAGKETNRLEGLADIIGVKLSVADSGEAIFIESLDGVAREVARRTLTVAANMSRPFPENPRGLVGDISGRLTAEIDELGVRAFKELEIPTSHAEINRLVGRLRYRTSYTQNQWQHAIEVGFLCGLLADEMGEDRAAARRAGLLHDIGKAVSHEMDGSHAVIGGDYARRLGEKEEIANAIAAHHADEPCNSVIAYLTAASDALSGARPGARREIVETYGRRIEDLEAIAHATHGVQRAFALQAGRELRVFVDGQKVTDLQARDISLSIARRVEDELVYPGQIRVTVIRQMRSEAVAR
jgi:ribonuclease Y